MPTTDRFAGPLAACWPGVTAGTLRELLKQAKRRLPVPPAGDRGTWAPGNVDATTLADLRERADVELGTPWPVPTASGYARYFRDGDRDAYEQIVFGRERRLTRAAVVAAVTLEPRWIDEAADGAILLCEQSSWCWPAHDDTRSAHGAVVPTATDPCLDLGAGQVAAQLAWLDHLLGEQFDDRIPGVRARIRYEVDRRVLTPFQTRRDWHWLGLDGDVHNWSAWIHGNVLVAALRLVDDEDRRAALVDLVIEGLDRYVAALPADGAIDEGYAYWWNGACRALEALDLLAYATAGALDASGVGALRATVAFPHRMHLGGAWYLNHADGPARPPGYQPWDALHRAARWVGDTEAQAHAAAQRRPGGPVGREHEGLGRLLRALTDPAWLSALPTDPPLPRDVWLPSTQVLLARPRAGSAAGLTLAAKGGHNGEHHNHNDVGAVVVALGGVPVLVDAGRPTYTAQTFGPDRYAIWTMQSSWHNVPEIRGVPQPPGRDHGARDVRATVEDAATTLALDLAGAYPPAAGVRAWRRTARLERGTGTVTITDSWELEPGTTERAGPEPPGTVRLHLVLAGQVELGAGGAGTAEITALDGAGTVALTWQPSTATGTTTVRELDDPMLSDVWGGRLTRLELDASASGPVGTFVLTVKEL